MVGPYAQATSWYVSLYLFQLLLQFTNILDILFTTILSICLEINYMKLMVPSPLLTYLHFNLVYRLLD